MYSSHNKIYFYTLYIRFDIQGEFDAGYLYECKFMTDSDKTIVAEQKTDIPLKAVPVLESNDVPISVIRFR